MYFPLLYAETHYHLKYLFPKYFKKEPEVIFDLPFRVVLNRVRNIPVFIIVKDADRFCGKIEDILIKILCNGKTEYRKITETFELSKKLEYFKININISEEWIERFVDISVSFSLSTAGGCKKYTNDNYYGTKEHYFRTYISQKFLDDLYGWYAGDVHYHSEYTSDQVEFGAPLEVTKDIAYSMGLDWFFVTDHSYDLDDCEDNYLINDLELPKWNDLKRKSRELSDSKLKIVFGEEVSIGNLNNQNVHLLSVNEDCFISGSGDSAERWFKNIPEESIKNIPEIDSDENLFIAAHPFDKVPYLQRILLNRGNWDISDFKKANISFLQLINGQSPEIVEMMFNKWLNLLVEGNDFLILAGNDAHGNFQYMKQISVPFIRLMCRKEQLFGQYFTLFHYAGNMPVKGIKNKRIIVSNGPFIEFFLDEATIGDTVCKENANLSYSVYSDNEFGNINEICLYVGDRLTKKIKKTYNIENACQIKLPQYGFCVMTVKTVKGHIAITNPINIKR